MRVSIAGSLIGIAVAVSSAAAAGGTDRSLSATVILQERGQDPIAQQFFAKEDKARLETRIGPRETIHIVDAERNEAWVLMPEQRLAMIVPPADVRSSAPGPGTWLPTEDEDSTNPCERGTGLNCTRAGKETIAGRQATRWIAREGGEVKARYWVDEELGLLLKYESDDTRMEMTNIRFRPLPDRLFEVPRDWEVDRNPATPFPSQMTPPVGR